MGWRIRPHKVRIRCGRPADLPAGVRALADTGHGRDRPHLAVRDAPVGVARRAPAAAPGRRRRRGLLGHRARGRARARRRRGPARLPDARAGRGGRRAGGENERYLPGVRLPETVSVRSAAELELAGADLVCFAVPARELPAALAEHGGRGPRARRRARRRQRARAAARHAAHGLRRRARRRQGRRLPRRPGARRAPRSRTARRSWSPRSTTPTLASSPTCSAARTSTCSAPRTSPASSSPAAPRTPRRWPPPPPRAPGRTPRAPPPARCSRRSRGWRAAAARGRRPSPGSPAPGDLVATVMADERPQPPRRRAARRGRSGRRRPADPRSERGGGRRRPVARRRAAERGPPRSRGRGPGRADRRPDRAGDLVGRCHGAGRPAAKGPGRLTP